MSDAELEKASGNDSSDVLPIDKGSKDRDDGCREPSNHGGIYAGQGSGAVRDASERGDQEHQAIRDASLKKEAENDLKAVVEECRKFAAALQEKHGAAVLILCETVFREGFHVASGMNLQTTLGLLDLTAFHVKNQLNQKKEIR